MKTSAWLYENELVAPAAGRVGFAAVLPDARQHVRSHAPVAIRLAILDDRFTSLITDAFSRWKILI